MPIQLNLKFKHVAKEVRLKIHLAGNGSEWVTWWYCGIYKNHLAESQPKILVAFRELSSGELSDDIVFQRVPLTSLGQIRIGTVWKDALCRSEAVFDTEDFSIDFTEGAWQFTSFYDAAERNAQPPYLRSIYPTRYPKDKNWLIEFPLSTGGKLIVPCIEFFSRCYGRSEELKRILATYAWQGEKDTNSRLYAPIGEPEEPNKWKVKLRKKLVNGDTTFLAHAKYERYTTLAAKRIYGQIESQDRSERGNLAFIKVTPWFQGPAKLRVKGIRFDNGKSFLGLQVVGSSDPEGVPIQRGRDNSNLTYLPAEGDELGNAWSGAPERVMNKLPEIINLTGDEEPDQGAATIEILDPDFVVLGVPRTVIDVRRGRANSKSGRKIKGSDETTFSSGEPHGSGKSVGYASIHARPVMESRGMLRDMWDALLFLQKDQPGLIQAVEWFTFEDGFCSEAEPKLIELQPFDKNDEVSGTIRNWPYLDANRGVLRGVLVARVQASGKIVHFVEIQRRSRKKKSDDGEIKGSEESFTGLAFVLNEQRLFQEYLRKLLSEIRWNKGVFKNISGKCPGNATAFPHKSSKFEKVSCEAALLNAFSKIGVNY